MILKFIFSLFLFLLPLCIFTSQVFFQSFPCLLLTTYHVLLPTHQAGTRTAQPCNVYVFCPTRPSAGVLCCSNDVWNHSYGECWLKHQADPSRPEAGAYGAYPAGYRRKHRTAPEQVQWMSGSLSPTPLTVDGPKWHW